MSARRPITASESVGSFHTFMGRNCSNKTKALAPKLPVFQVITTTIRVHTCLTLWSPQQGRIKIVSVMLFGKQGALLRLINGQTLKWTGGVETRPHFRGFNWYALSSSLPNFAICILVLWDQPPRSTDFLHAISIARVKHAVKTRFRGELFAMLLSCWFVTSVDLFHTPTFVKVGAKREYYAASSVTVVIANMEYRELPARGSGRQPPIFLTKATGVQM
ncbi:uncharacterized protein FOMMEDRAFT_155969 [Fomitiporia mediterranea MF3/22]|uniref:uncharacterized protein n=1 Tax=Fomitiporia mediterranea (strain MF3/22) TaxID=694068 RepID=UPI000440984E|nr:uncharacterized protein FOMMEDRAFT_155969 [Fomitiporia mediterranea MF3/22]EJD02645.1 hypothetical protein FOMMEDRAFT_155969 [Fomitiporia mediterranea MF3/22]